MSPRISRSRSALLALLLVTVPGCDQSPAPQSQNQGQGQGRNPASRQADIKLATELAAARFFLANPSEETVGWESLKEEALALSGSSTIPATVLAEMEGKTFARPLPPRNQPPAPPAGSSRGAAESPPSLQPAPDAEGFSVSLVPSVASVHRGQRVKFTATTGGGGQNPEFHFVKTVPTGDPGIDEIPEPEGNPSRTPEFEAAFDQVGQGRVMVRAYDASGKTARTFASVAVTNRPPDLRVESLPRSAFRSQKITPTVLAEDPDGDPVELAVLSPGGDRLSSGTSPEFEFGEVGSFAVKIVATDSLGASSETASNIEITNRPPVVSVQPGELRSNPGKPLEISPSSSDPDNDPVSLVVRVEGGKVEEGPPGVYRIAADSPGKHEVRVEATDGLGAKSEFVSFLEVENRPPEIKYLASPPAGPRRTPVLLVESVSDPDGDQVSVKTVSGGAEKTWPPGTPPSLEFTDLGPHEVEIVAEDSRGARVSNRVSVNITNASPSVSLTLSPEKIHRNSEVSVTASASDPESEDLLYKFSAPGISPSASTSPELKFTPSALGSVKVSVVVSDPHGGVATAEREIDVIPRPPEISAKADKSSGSRTDEFQVEVSGMCPETGNPVKKFKMLEPPGWKKTERGFAGKFASLGTQKVRIEAESEIGAKGEVSAEVTVTNVPPTISLLTPPPPYDRSRPVRFAAKYGDADGPPSPAEVEWSVDGGRVLSRDGATAVVEFGRLGEASVTATAKDHDGASATASASAKVENLPPSVSASVESGPYYRKKPARLNATAADPDGSQEKTRLEVMMDGTALQGQGPEYAVTPERLGTHSVTVKATDEDGASSEKQISFEVSNALPKVSLKVPDGPVPANAEVLLEASAEDMESQDLSYAFEVDGVRLPATASSSSRVSFAKPGMHRVVVTVTDPDGGKSTASGDIRAK